MFFKQDISSDDDNMSSQTASSKASGTQTSTIPREDITKRHTETDYNDNLRNMPSLPPVVLPDLCVSRGLASEMFQIQEQINKEQQYIMALRLMQMFLQKP